MIVDKPKLYLLQVTRHDLQQFCDTHKLAVSGSAEYYRVQTAMQESLLTPNFLKLFELLNVQSDLPKHIHHPYTAKWLSDAVRSTTIEPTKPSFFPVSVFTNQMFMWTFLTFLVEGVIPTPFPVIILCEYLCKSFVCFEDLFSKILA